MLSFNYRIIPNIKPTNLSEKDKKYSFLIDKEDYSKVEELLTENYNTISEYKIKSDLNNINQEVIDLSKSDYIKSSLYKIHNIILIPFNHQVYGDILAPFEILDISKKSTTLFSKQILWYISFNESKQKEISYHNSSIRKYLNSQEFLDQFPKYIHKKITYHTTKTNNKSSRDRFWLISIDEIEKYYNLKERLMKYSKQVDNLVSELLEFNTNYHKEYNNFKKFLKETNLESLIKYPLKTTHETNKFPIINYWIRYIRLKRPAVITQCPTISIDTNYNPKQQGLCPVFKLNNI